VIQDEVVLLVVPDPLNVIPVFRTRSSPAQAFELLDGNWMVSQSEALNSALLASTHEVELALMTAACADTQQSQMMMASLMAMAAEQAAALDE
jgi:hypothetical protein